VIDRYKKTLAKVGAAGVLVLTTKGMGKLPMAHAKDSSKRNSRKRAAPALGIAGVSLAMVGGASASTAGSAVDVPVQNTATHHELFLGEEEISTMRTTQRSRLA
jgi:hypothetical protein